MWAAQASPLLRIFAAPCWPRLSGRTLLEGFSSALSCFFGLPLDVRYMGVQLLEVRRAPLEALGQHREGETGKQSGTDAARLVAGAPAAGRDRHRILDVGNGAVRSGLPFPRRRRSFRGTIRHAGPELCLFSGDALPPRARSAGPALIAAPTHGEVIVSGRFGGDRL
jgi:hypothetical protein